MPYVEQRSTELALYLFDAPAPRGAVRVLAERQLELPGGRITLAIIGSSHFLEIETGGDRLCELLACPRPGLDNLAEWAETIGGDGWSHRLRRGTISYSFDLWKRRYPQGSFEETCAGLSLPGPQRLRFAFPGGDGAGSALTCLEWRLEGKQTAISTHHTFPGELAIVHTRSVIDFADAGASA